MSERTKPPSGGRKLMDAGRKPILLGATEAEHDLLRQAAEAERRPITQFLLHHGLVAAKKILKNRPTSA